MERYTHRCNAGVSTYKGVIKDKQINIIEQNIYINYTSHYGKLTKVSIGREGRPTA